jgi:hypothetical protein
VATSLIPEVFAAIIFLLLKIIILSDSSGNYAIAYSNQIFARTLNDDTLTGLILSIFSSQINQKYKPRECKLVLD